MSRIKHHFDAHKRKVLIVLILLLVSVSAYVIYFRYYGVLPQSTIYLFQPMPRPVATDRIIVFSPHEDDESLGAGGYVSNAKRAGAQVLVVFATDGNKHGLKILREQEAVGATGALGLTASDVQFYNYPDGNLGGHEGELEQSITQTVQAFHPTKVFVTDPVDIHPDHAALGVGVKYSVPKVSPATQIYTFVIHYTQYPRPQIFRPHAFMLPPTALISQNRQWFTFTLDGQDFDNKYKAVLEYKSQLKTPFLHSLMLSFVRQNEMFSKDTP